MNWTDENLRELVREAIASHLGPNIAESSSGMPSQGTRRVQGHASHGVFRLTDGSDAGGPCLIEPAAHCSHCGYCQSYGH